MRILTFLLALFLAAPAAANSITWVNEGANGVWDDGESVAAADMNAIQTAMEANFDTDTDIGATLADCLYWNGSAWDDSTAACLTQLSTEINSTSVNMNADNGGAEPANNSGYSIDGGSGTDITIFYNSTSNALEFDGAAAGYHFDYLTITIDYDGAAAEPADGAGIVIEGGSGTDIGIKYEATDNTLDFTGTTGGYDFDGAVTATSFAADDRTTEPGNRIQVNDNDTAFTNDPTCTNSGEAGELTILDKNEGSGAGEDEYVACDGTTEIISFHRVVKSAYWGASGLSSDGTECSDPAEVTINSGPKLFAVDCPMGTSETDGFVYGSVVLPDGFDKTADVTFEITTYVQDDQGAQTWQGVLEIMCHTHQDTIDSTWDATAGLDVDADVADVANDILQDVSGAVDTDTTGANCDAGDTLFWRWRSCDTDATPSTGCTSSAGAEADFGILGFKMEYTWNQSGD